MPVALVAPRYFTCQSCGLEFELGRGSRGKPDRCSECKPIHDRRLRLVVAEQRKQARKVRAAEDTEREVRLPDGHPVLPILTAFANHQCAVRLALLAIDRGEYRVARDALAGCLEAGAQ